MKYCAKKSASYLNSDNENLLLCWYFIHIYIFLSIHIYFYMYSSDKIIAISKLIKIIY